MTRLNINENAPAIASQEIWVQAPVELVWGLLSDLGRWPQQNRSVYQIEILGPVAPGTKFRWVADGSRIRSRLQEVDPPHRIVWSGSTMGIKAVHVCEFHPEKGGTRVRTRKSFSGLVARLLAKRLEKMLSQALGHGREALKQEAENATAP